MDKIKQQNVVTEMKDSFIDYSMSVIVSRALPDLRDGLKPVHRRILYGMFEGGVTPDKQYRKSARTVGDVMGKYHPHGDSSIYDAMVGMAQDWNYRHPLVDGQGNFGTRDGDGAAAMRYTEARLSKIALDLLRDINKDTVDFVPNFDGTEMEPVILPSRFPNILINGTMGIAVGMATNIPPHNLGEVINGCVAYIDNNDIEISELATHIKGPDFPTGATILGNSGIMKALETGRGSITIRAKVEIEENNGKSKIIITELPYKVNKSELQKKIGELVRDKIIDGIADLQDLTSIENPVKIVVVLKKDANANVILNQLYKHTQLQTSFGINFLMIDQGRPKTLNIKEIISKYIDYQKEIIIRRTKFELKKAEDRVHILEGLKIALDHLDEVIKLIRGSKTDSEAKTGLITRFSLSGIQADAILEMKLRRLTGLERDKIENELNELLKEIENLNGILASEEKILNIIKTELIEIKNKYADERRTKIDMTAIEYIEDESLIPEENILVTLTNKGYIKRTTSEVYKTQNRGGVGVKGMSTNEEDFVEHLINLSTHDYIMFFSNRGKVYRLKGYEIPEYGRNAKGLPIINLLQLDREEYINSIIPLSVENEVKTLLFATEKGLVKRTKIEEFDSIRVNGKICIKLKSDDELIAVRKTTGESNVLMASSEGRMVVFDESEVRVMGRTASGVKGINLDQSKCIGVETTIADENILMVTEKGYGKKTLVSEYRKTKRGGKGVKALNVTAKNGKLVAFKKVEDDKDAIIITDFGTIIRMPVSQVPQLSRVTQGTRLINLKEEQQVSTISIIEREEEDTIIEEAAV
ncbi:MAG: DNA gyrase subunit A [Bacilli bacterium]|nr:DNA gyrase subunit A [Bacilli bacterium]MDD4795137.1 DNA gyrase subunit A [Bacilli bacterium]